MCTRTCGTVLRLCCDGSLSGAYREPIDQILALHGAESDVDGERAVELMPPCLPPSIPKQHLYTCSYTRMPLRIAGRILPLLQCSRVTIPMASLPYPISSLFRPLLPTPSMPPLLPLLHHLRHPLHRPSPLLQASPERPLPKLSLDLLPHACALHS